jgi:DNA-binding MarR family transcriptional regulator
MKSRARSKAAGKEESDARLVLDSIRRIVRFLRIASRESEKRLGLSAAQVFVLHKLADGRPLSLNQLAQRTLTHQSSVSVVVQRLVEQGLVERARSEVDGRAVMLTLTAEGRSTLKKAPDAPHDRLIQSLEQMKPGDRRKLAMLLRALLTTAGLTQEQPEMLFADDVAAKGERAKGNGKEGSI